MALGATHYRWRGDVEQIVSRIEARWPRTSCNTYVDHPWPGWDSVSIDVWGIGGRGDPVPLQDGWEIRRFLKRIDGDPDLRHTIYLHQLWTSFGGYSRWVPDDHSGKFRHLHVTYWL